MSKHGDLLASDLIPKLGKELNNTFNNVNSDTIEGALNRVGNTFEELTAKVGTGNIYKSIVNEFGDGFKWVVDNLSTVGNAIVNIISTVIIGKAFTMIKTGYNEIATTAEASYIKQAVATEKTAVIQELSTSTLSKSSKKRYLDESLDIAKSTAAQEFSAVKTSIVWETAWLNIKGAAISAMSAFAPLLIISGIIAIGQYLKGLYDRQQELNKVTSDYKNGLKNAGSGDSGVKDLTRLKGVINDTNNSLKDRQNALNIINGILGTNYKYDEKGLKINGDINKSINDRISLLTKAAEIQYLVNQKMDTEGKLDENLKKQNEEIKSIKDNSKSPDPVSMGIRMFHENELSKLKEERQPLKENYSSITKKLDNYVPSGSTERNLNSGGGATGDGEETPAQKHKKEIETAIVEYVNKTNELNNQLANGVIKQKEFNKQFDKHVEDGKTKFGGILTPAESKDSVLFNQMKAYKPTDKLTLEEDKYIESIKDIEAEKKAGLLTDEEYRSAMLILINSTLKAAYKIDGFDIEKSSLGKKLTSDKTEFQKKDLSKYDYKSKFEYLGKGIDGEQGIKKGEFDLEQAKKELEDLKKLALKSSVKMDVELDLQLSKVTSLDKALNLLKVKKDIKDLQKELNNGLYDGIKNIASSASNIVNAFKNLKETMNSTNTSGFEKIMGIFDALFNTIDSIMSVVKLVQTLTEVTKSLGIAKQAESAIDTATTGAKVVNAGIGASATVAEAAVEVPAKTAVAGAGAAASVAAVPIVGPILAIAAVAGILALIGGLPKFANGGIVGGSSFSGDKIMAGLNSGEMVLNGGQQSTLFGLLNGQGSTNGANTINGGTVEFVIEGKHLKGVLDNYGKIKSKV